MWPVGFERIPKDDPWVTSPVEELALKYDAVENHGWYRNLEPTLDDMQRELCDGHVMIDYSGGTGILVEQFLKRVPDRRAGFLIVDASPKFLRLALEKLGADERTAFRWIRFLKSAKRLELLDEILPPSLVDNGVDLLCSTNAIHLYFDLADTLASWARLLKPGALALIQSGNIHNPETPQGSWIIDETVERIQPIAQRLVEQDARFRPFRAALDDSSRMDAYAALRRRFFIPVRPLAFYVKALNHAGFEIVQSYHRVFEAMVSDWIDFLSAYHEGVLGWAGGSRRIDGADPDDSLVELRRQLLSESLSALFEGRSSFPACWSYLNARRNKT